MGEGGEVEVLQHADKSVSGQNYKIFHYCRPETSELPGIQAEKIENIKILQTFTVLFISLKMYCQSVL